MILVSYHLVGCLSWVTHGVCVVRVSCDPVCTWSMTGSWPSLWCDVSLIPPGGMFILGHSWCVCSESFL